MRDFASFQWVSGEVKRIEDVIKKNTLATQRWLRYKKGVTVVADATSPHPREWNGDGFDPDKKWTYLYRIAGSDETYQWIYDDPFGEKDTEPSNNDTGKWSLYSTNKEFIDTNEWEKQTGYSYDEDILESDTISGRISGLTFYVDSVSGDLDTISGDIWKKPGGIEDRVSGLEFNKLDKNINFGDDGTTRIVDTTEGQFVLRTSKNTLGAEVGTTKSGAIAMSTTENKEMTMFGTYSTSDNVGDLRAQITARKNDEKTGTRLLVTTDNIYYTKGKINNNKTLDDEILVLSDISGKLDKQSTMNTDTTNNIGVLPGNGGEKFVMTSHTPAGLGAEVGITETNAAAMSTTEADGAMTMFGTYSSEDTIPDGIKAQITARDKDKFGTRILLTKDNVYYTKGRDTPNFTVNDEILVASDISGKLDKVTTMGDFNNEIGVISNKFIMTSHNKNGTIGAEVGITETGAAAMSTTTDRTDMTMFGTYSTEDVAYITSGIRAQITARDGSEGTRILITKEAAYYSGDAGDINFVKDPKKEIAVLGDLDPLSGDIWNDSGRVGTISGLVSGLSGYVFENKVVINKWGNIPGTPHNSSNLENKRVILIDHNQALLYKEENDDVSSLIPQWIKENTEEPPDYEDTNELDGKEALIQVMSFTNVDTGKSNIAFKTYNEDDKQKVNKWTGLENLTTVVNSKADSVHTHTDYVTITKFDKAIFDVNYNTTLNLAGKSDNTHNHDQRYAPLSDSNLIKTLLSKIETLEQNFSNNLSIAYPSLPAEWVNPPQSFALADPNTLITKSLYTQSELDVIGNASTNGVPANGAITRYAEINYVLKDNEWIAVKINGIYGVNAQNNIAVVVNHNDILNGGWGWEDSVENFTRFKLPIYFLEKINGHWKPKEALQSAPLEIVVMSGAQPNNTVVKTIFAGYLPTIKVQE